MKINIKILLIALIILVAPVLSLAQSQGPVPCQPGHTPTTSLCNGLGNSNTFFEFLQRFFAFVGTVIGLLAVTMIVYSGFRMLIARGEPENLKTAKSGFAYALIGVVVSALSFAIVLSFQNFLGFTGVQNGSLIKNPLQSPTMQQFIIDTVSGFVALMGILASVMIVYNAYLYITSGGNEQQTTKAKSGLLWSVVGFLTVLLAYVIINALKGLIVGTP